jgi:hypothetical protein
MQILAFASRELRKRRQRQATRLPVVPCERKQRWHRRARWQPTMRCGLEFDFLDVVVAADGTPYASVVDGCTAEERHSRPGQGIVGHVVSGLSLVGTAEEQRPRVTLPRRCRRPLRIRLRQPRRGRLVSARIYVNGRSVRTVRDRRLRAPIQLVRLPRGRVGVMIVARTSTGRTVVHTRRYRTCAR